MATSRELNYKGDDKKIMRMFREKEPRTYNENQVIDAWLSCKMQFFSDRGNLWYGKEEIFRQVAKNHLRTGEHGPDYDDLVIMKAQSLWDEWLTFYDEIEPQQEVAER